MGVATAQAYLSQDRKASATRRAQSEVWGGDLLLISIPGAAPDQLTEVRFIVESKGVVSPAGGNAALWLCFGLRNGAQGACPDKLSRDGRDALHLPRGVNVVVPGQAKTTAGAGESWRHRQTVVMTMRGAEALVPFWYYLQAQTGGLDANGSRAQLLGMSIELPEGATCASRSRTAFGGACPKRKVPGG